MSKRARARTPRFRLYARPKKPPKWWPAGADGAPAWVGVRDDGWQLGAGDVMTMPEVKLAKRSLEIPAPVEYRTEEVG